MYFAHFGLSQAPFRITPNTEFFFPGGCRGTILDALVYAIVEGEGIVKVCGEVGSGKTMLCRMLLTRLPERIETVYLSNPNVSPEEVLHAITLELGLATPQCAGRLQTLQTLHEHLLKRHAQGRQVVVFVEEAQTIPIPTLEEMRLLFNLETERQKLLQIVLFGQPELERTLALPEIRQLKERITHSFTLPPLAREEVGEYLAFRLCAAGYRGPDLFSGPVVRYIARASQGLTRRINILADKTLLAAFAEDARAVKLKHAKSAAQDSEFAAQSNSGARRRWMKSLACALAGVALGAALFGAFDALATSASAAAAARHPENLLPQ
jgi:MSHA biogenesis protein MshM